MEGLREKENWIRGRAGLFFLGTFLPTRPFGICRPFSTDCSLHRSPPEQFILRSSYTSIASLAPSAQAPMSSLVLPQPGAQFCLLAFYRPAHPVEQPLLPVMQSAFQQNSVVQECAGALSGIIIQMIMGQFIMSFPSIHINQFQEE